MNSQSLFETVVLGDRCAVGIEGAAYKNRVPQALLRLPEPLARVRDRVPPARERCPTHRQVRYKRRPRGPPGEVERCALSTRAASSWWRNGSENRPGQRPPMVAAAASVMAAVLVSPAAKAWVELAWRSEKAASPLISAKARYGGEPQGGDGRCFVRCPGDGFFDVVAGLDQEPASVAEVAERQGQREINPIAPSPEREEFPAARPVGRQRPSRSGPAIRRHRLATARFLGRWRPPTRGADGVFWPLHH